MNVPVSGDSCWIHDNLITQNHLGTQVPPPSFRAQLRAHRVPIRVNKGIATALIRVNKGIGTALT